MNTADPNGPSLEVNAHARDETVLDPCHEVTCTTRQIFGEESADPKGRELMDGCVLGATAL